MSFETIIKALDFRDKYENRVSQAANYIRGYLEGDTPAFGVVLGSGLGDLADSIEGAQTIDYKDIPHFPITTVAGHEGKIIIGKLEGVNVIGLKGRVLSRKS